MKSTDKKNRSMDEFDAELDKRYVERLRDNFELVDVVKETGSVKTIQSFMVDTDEGVVGLVYTDDTAEIVPFDEFEDNQWGLNGLNYQ